LEGKLKIFKGLLEQIKKLDGKWGLVIKIYLIITFIYISYLIIEPIVYNVYLSFAKYPISVISVPIYDESTLERIVLRINEEEVNLRITKNGIIKVENAEIARHVRAILIRENLLPSGNINNELERIINLQRAREMMIRHQIKAIDGILNTNTMIFWANENYPNSSVSLMITPEPDSDITRNRKKIEGIQKYLLNSIEGLRLENIVIIDNAGFIINDFKENIELEE